MKRLVVGIVVVMLAAAARAQEVWVDAANGNDTTGNGTLAQPWRTITFALTQPVTTLRVLPGTYDSALGETFPIPIRTNTSIVGAEAATTIVRGVAGSAVFRAAYASRGSLPPRLLRVTVARELGTLAPGIDLSFGLASTPELEIGSCVIEGHSDGVRANNFSGSPRIHDCIIRGNQGDGIRLMYNRCSSGAPIIERNLVESNGDRGIEIESWCRRQPPDPNQPTTSVQLTIRGNTIQRNNKGIFVLAGLLWTFEFEYWDGEVLGSIDANWIADNVDAGIVLRAESTGRLNVTVTNCVFVGNAAGIRTVVYSPYMAIPPRLTPLVVNDTFVANTAAGYAESPSPYASSLLINTILAGNADDLLGLTFDQVRFSDVGDGEFAGSIGNISADPQFVDGAARDFHLRATSPCLELGSPQGAMNASAWVDFDEQARDVDANRDGVRSVDMGAFEFGADGLGWRYGNVGAAVGFPRDVVSLNGGAGDADRVVHLPAGMPATLDVAAPPRGPSPAPFALLAYVGIADATTVSRQPGGLGRAAIPTPLNGSNPRVIVALDNLPAALRAAIGEGRFPSTPAPLSLTIPGRLASAGIGVTLQGIIADAGSRQGSYALTNALIVRVP